MERVCNDVAWNATDPKLVFIFSINIFYYDIELFNVLHVSNKTL